MMPIRAIRITVVLLTVVSQVADAAQDQRLVDRTAIERVYHSHRTGTTLSFEQVMPPNAVGRLVKDDLHKEAVLRRVYGVEVTAAMVEAEVHRIDTTTRAPAVLAELKAALDNDPIRFAATVARPIVVERLLREKFENDDQVHLDQRRQVEAVRVQLLGQTRGTDRESILKQNHTESVSVVKWQLGARPETAIEGAHILPVVGKASAGSYEVEATVASTITDTERHYFRDLPEQLQALLNVQLCKPGDVSAVVETPSSFALFVLKERAADALIVAALTVSKRNYETWLAEQKECRNES